MAIKNIITDLVVVEVIYSWLQPRRIIYQGAYLRTKSMTLSSVLFCPDDINVNIDLHSRFGPKLHNRLDRVETLRLRLNNDGLNMTGQW